MKNNLFRKFLAVFLTGTLLGAVGCKDYDDDINDLKGQIDDLKGKIELKADASALQAITDKLQNVDFSAFVTSRRVTFSALQMTHMVLTVRLVRPASIRLKLDLSMSQRYANSCTVRLRSFLNTNILEEKYRNSS